MRHLITTRDLANDEVLALFKDAESFLDEKPRDLLKGKSITTIFFENSTRTLSSFEGRDALRHGCKFRRDGTKRDCDAPRKKWSAFKTR